MGGKAKSIIMICPMTNSGTNFYNAVLQRKGPRRDVTILDEWKGNKSGSIALLVHT